MSLDAPSQIESAHDIPDSDSAFSEEQATTNPRAPGDGTVQEHPKVYVGWAKHAIYEKPDTHHTGSFDQLLGGEYRSDDWWSYVPSGKPDSPKSLLMRTRADTKT